MIPAGRFRMGCVSGQECDDDELPVHDVTIPQAFAVSKYEVTFEDYDRYTYPNRVDDEGLGRGRRPVINVSWNDAQDYVEWLSAQTGHTYRLLSEAEWEYVARAGSSTSLQLGQTTSARTGQTASDGGSQWDDDRTAPVGSFPANAFGVHDMHGNVWEWVEDCYNGSYAGAPSDAVPGVPGNCEWRVLRGGAGTYDPRGRAAPRYRAAMHRRGSGYYFLGSRVARTLTPLNPYLFTSFGGFQGGRSPLGGGKRGLSHRGRAQLEGNAGRPAPNRARTTGAALGVRTTVLFCGWCRRWERFPIKRKVLLGDRIQGSALDGAGAADRGDLLSSQSGSR